MNTKELILLVIIFTLPFILPFLLYILGGNKTYILNKCGKHPVVTQHTLTNAEVRIKFIGEYIKYHKCAGEFNE